MCGIIGYIGTKPCVELIYNALKRLEYRGYDSSGIAVLYQGNTSFVKAPGKLKDLQPYLKELPEGATIGIGHTRWATHGIPNIQNAHPHVYDKLAIVHNGIIENFRDLKAGLQAAGAKFESETDTEVILLLLWNELQKTSSINEAIITLTKKLKGAYSLGIIHKDNPDSLYLIKQGSPLVIGLGDGENFFGSDAAALIDHTHQAIFLNDGEFACLKSNEINIWNFNGEPITRTKSRLQWSPSSLEKKGFSHFMLKEIYEQPDVFRNTISRLIDPKTEKINYSSLGIIGNIDFKSVSNINIVACGTAYYSGLLGKFALESLAHVPVNVELASEFRYRKPFLNKGSLIIAISQSGETADTLACIKYAKEQGVSVFSICNVQYSSIPRNSDSTLYMEAGPEIGVASTKAFTCMVLCQYLFALALAEIKDAPIGDVRNINKLRSLPLLMEKILSKGETIKEIANKYYDFSQFLYIGRGEHFPIALEGALKLKEISYIHAEGYAAGELKHGPIALIDKNIPLIALAPQDAYYSKTLANIEEVKARNGRIIGVGKSGDSALKNLCDDIIECPQLNIPILQAMLSIVPLQLFSYYMALRRGADIDQPRNLAKSVTVE